MIYIPTNCHFQTTRKRLKNSFDFVMLILATRLDVQIHPRGIAQAFEEMQEHLCRHLTDALTMELGIPDQPGPSTEIQSHLTETIVHRKRIAITFDAALAAQCLIDAIAQGKGGVFDGVMLIDMQISYCTDIQVDVAMPRNLFKHVVKESQACGNISPTVSVKIQTDANIGFARSPANSNSAISAQEDT